MAALPTIKHLSYFLALTEHEHFGRAAAASFVSQSAFSVAIKDLETLLGADLVDRTNRQVTITAMGRDIATQARLVMQDLDALMQTAKGQQQPLSGPLRLGVIPTIAPFLLPRLLPALRRKFPKLQLFLREGLTEDLRGRLADGDLDLVLIALPYEMRNVETLPLFRDHFHLAYREGTELVDPENYRFNRLNASSVLLLEEGHCLREHTIEACRIRSTEAVSPFAASSLLTLVEMVDADLGITYLPEMASGSALLSGTRVKTTPLSGRSFRHIGLGWRRGSSRAEEFADLGEFISNFHGRSSK